MTINELNTKLKHIKEIGKGEYTIRIHTNIDGYAPCIADIVNEMEDCFSVDDMFRVITIHSRED